MLNNTLKLHLNQIDSSLKSTFGTVKFTHDDAYHSSIEVSDISINEDLAPIKVIIKIEHEKLNRDTTKVDWTYRIDPNNDASTEIKRTSLIENIGNDVLDVVVNKRMDKEYIDSCLISLINEEAGMKYDVCDLCDNEGREPSCAKCGKTLDYDDDGDDEIIDETLDFSDDDDDDEFQIGESIIFTDYEYNEQKGTIEKKTSLTILDKEYKGWIVKTEDGSKRQVMDYDVHRDSRMPKWWNN